MTLHDISLTLSETLPTWPGDPVIQLRQISSIAEGDDANVTQVSMSVHTGTHIDAPDHFLGNGDTVDNIPLDLLVGKAVVVEILTEGTITKEDLKKVGIPAGITRILFKTSNSAYWAAGNQEFQEDFIALGEDAAKYLVSIGIEVVGVDYLSVAPYADSAPTHRVLLEAGILIIEGLDLSRVTPGEYTLLCLPLKIGGSDGAPARVLLRD
ncbi:MAG: cyclase family protein [Anaerolineales bacterium]